jgi:hypothetical protein
MFNVKILAIGVSHYSDIYLKDLPGPRQDLDNLKRLLVESTQTALFAPEQFIELFDPESDELRYVFNNYLLEGSKENDILILYFSGHGVSIGRDDFGFCTSDTIIHPTAHVALPLSVIKFSEILKSIQIANVIPIIIIDACYSGIAGRALIVPSSEAISNLHGQLNSVVASSYALLCSCSDDEKSIDTPTGGVFSNALVNIASEGLPNSQPKKPLLSLSDIFPRLTAEVLKYTGETIPRLYLGDTLPEFPLFLNSKFTSSRYSLSPTFIRILEALWNTGDEKYLSPEEIGELCGHSAYCNHNKLSFAPWDLVETVPNSRNRRLTEQGRQFMRGEIYLPKTIMQDPRSGKIVALENTILVNYHTIENK